MYRDDNDEKILKEKNDLINGDNMYYLKRIWGILAADWVKQMKELVKDNELAAMDLQTYVNDMFVPLSKSRRGNIIFNITVSICRGMLVKDATLANVMEQR